MNHGMLWPLNTFLLAGLCGGVVCARAAAEDRGQAGLVKSEFIYETAPFPECHASTIAETKGGLVAAWFGGTGERHPDVGIWLSRQSGGQWSAPVEVANGVQSPTNRYACWNPVLFQPSIGTPRAGLRPGAIPGLSGKQGA